MSAINLAVFIVVYLTQLTLLFLSARFCFRKAGFSRTHAGSPAGAFFYAIGGLIAIVAMVAATVLAFISGSLLVAAVQLVPCPTPLAG
ncbi:TPA: hypothetical protein ACKP1A_000582 [Stenotrophomonas maltophilia]